MSDLMPLLSRDRYTDDEWEYSTSGRCDWITEMGMTPTIKRCGQPSSPDSFYRWCTGHDEQAREEDPSKYGK